MTALESHIFCSDLSAKAHHSLDIKLHALEVLLKLVAQLAEVVPDVRHLEEEHGLCGFWLGFLVRHVLAGR